VTLTAVTDYRDCFASKNAQIGVFLMKQINCHWIVFLLKMFDNANMSTLEAGVPRLALPRHHDVALKHGVPFEPPLRAGATAYYR
jgi:hypothetical protein